MVMMAGRSVTHLKVVNGVRYLIEMMIQVFIDMRYFLLLMLTIIVIFGAIFAQIQKTKMDDEEIRNSTRLKLFANGIDYVYNLGYGAWADSIVFDYNEYFYFALAAFVFPLVMFNLLIAIISDTFERVERKKELTDIRGIVDVLLDFSYFSSVFRKMVFKSSKNEGKYLHLIKAKKERLDEELEHKMNLMTRSCKDAKIKIEQIKHLVLKEE